VFNTEGGIIRQLLNVPVVIKSVNNGEQLLSPTNILIFFFLWYGFFITTYGVHVPSGLFLPGLILGCSVGLLYMQFMVYVMDFEIDRIGGQSYVIIGAAAMLAANSRMTYSLAVIMLETTQSINNFLPITLGIAVALVVGRIFNRSQYDYAIRSKQLPVLQHHMPKETGRMRVREIFLDKIDGGYELEVLESVSTV
jgi:H+/Cl- antiporter ClcA